MLAEDFGFYTQVMPSLFMFLGSGNPKTSLHSPTFDIDESILQTGVDVYLKVLESFEKKKDKHMETDKNHIKNQVKQSYGNIAQRGNQGCGDGCCSPNPLGKTSILSIHDISTKLGYSQVI
jgi:hypothetical protein